MMYDAYQGMADVTKAIVCVYWPKTPTRSLTRLVGASDRVAVVGAYERLLQTNWSRSPASPHARPDYSIDSIEIDGAPTSSVEERGVLWTLFCQLLRFRKAGGEDDPKILTGRAHVGPLRHSSARHDPHSGARPPGLHHRLGQSAQRESRRWRLHARGLYPTSHRLRALHRRGLPYRCGLPADGLGACGDCGHGARPQRDPAGEPDLDGRPDRSPRVSPTKVNELASGKANRMVPLQRA